jgi:GDP-L-fucose synthase
MSHILITGANGFLGKNLLRYWLSNNQDYDKLTTPSSKDVNLVSFGNTLQYMRKLGKIDGIIHLAALCGGIGINQQRPGDFIYRNLMMGANVLESARLLGVSKVVLLGTVCQYPKFTPSPFKEDDIWNGYPEETNAPYGIAKKTVMEMGIAYRRQFQMNIVSLIPTNLVGEFDHFEEDRSHVVPALIKKFGEAVRDQLPSVTVWGDGTASREFLDARDAARAIYLAYKNYNGDQPVNIGNNKEVTIKELVDTIAKLMKYKGEIIWDTTKPNGQPRRCLDVSRAKELFGFEAQIPLKESLTRTIEYAKEQGYA